MLWLFMTLKMIAQDIFDLNDILEFLINNFLNKIILVDLIIIEWQNNTFCIYWLNKFKLPKQNSH